MIKLTRSLTRETGLTMIDAFNKGYFNTGKVLEIELPINFSIFTQGTTIFYRDEKTFHERLPKEFSKLSKNEIYQNKLVEEAKKTVAIVENLKDIKNQLESNKDLAVFSIVNHLSQVRDLFIQGFPGLFVVFWFPIWQDNFSKNKIVLFDDNLILKLNEFRAESELYFNLGTETAFSALKNICSIKGWDFTLAKFLTFEELKQYLEKDEFPLELLGSRQQEKFGYLDKIIPQEELKTELERLNLLIEEKVEEIKEIKGNVANKGKARGKVKIVFSREQLIKVERGNILVAPMTTPWYMPAIKKVRAIVTDEGGITCHAAIVSREFGIPCIIGTKIATQVLEDGDLVEVDANKGVIRKLTKIKKEV